MEADDLAALLEQELGLLDDEDDNDEFDLDLTLFDRSATENVDTVVNDEDMNLLLLSASTLSALNVELSVSVPLEPEVEAEPKADLAVSSQVQEIISIQPYTFKDPEELTEEQKLVIADLMELMIESVERCAPILERTELAALQSTETIPSADHNIPIIINDELQANIVLEDIASEHPSHEIGLIDEKLVIESKIRKEELITAAQQSDQLVWEESRRYKEALEQERIRLEERKLRREQARLAALREKATVKFQSLV